MGRASHMADRGVMAIMRVITDPWVRLALDAVLHPLHGSMSRAMRFQRRVERQKGVSYLIYKLKNYSEVSTTYI